MRIKCIVVASAVASCLLAGITAGLSAQAVPDLSGTWNADIAKSDPAPPGVGRGRGNANVMVITTSATEITVSLGGADYIYEVDGSERTGPPGGETKSRMAWDNGRLVITWKREFFAGPDKGYETSMGKDTYTLAGTVLTVERMTTLPGQAPQTRRTVYNKAP